MAKLLWGKVYYGDIFAGIIREDTGGSMVFTYDGAYAEKGHPPLAHTLPVQPEPHISEAGLHPFFDNLVSEGRLEQVQSRFLGRRKVSRFELLLAFGFDCAGAVHVGDPEPSDFHGREFDGFDTKERVVLKNRASLSGVQFKLAVVLEGGSYRPAGIRELSTHIAKFPSPAHRNLVENEYLTTLAFRTLLPDDEVVEVGIEHIQGIDEPALLIRRFDRNSSDIDGGRRIKRLHFEEFNSLLGRASEEKYDGAYKDMASFILETPGCLALQAYVLYRRILAGLLLGNTDMHFKNFAMFHTRKGLRLTPVYDQVAASLYDYKTVALAMAGSRDRRINDLKANHVVSLGEEFGLSPAAIEMALKGFEKISGL